MSPWKGVKTCVMCVPVEGSAESPEEGSALGPHRPHRQSPASKDCSLNMPGVSLVLPNQFLEDRGLGHGLCTCSSVGVP